MSDNAKVAVISAGIAALLIAIITGRWPRWLRIILVLGITVVAAGAGLYAYRYTSRPTTLTVAAGSLDGTAVQLMSMIATRLATTGAPVRLQVVDKGNVLDATKAFNAGQADLAVVRPDLGDLSTAETVVVLTRNVVLLVVPPGSSVTDVDGLKGKSIGVVGGTVNRGVVDALTRQYALDGGQTRFKDLAVAEIPQALKAKDVNALLIVMPLTEKYLEMLRNLFPRAGKQRPALIEIDAAGAIAAVTKYYQSYDLPKGTLQGSPAIPDDDMKTLQVPLYLVANKKLSNDVVSSLARAIMAARRDLIGEYPFIAQVSEPDTDKTDSENDTYIPIHPGAAAYFGGNVQSFFDKYGDQLFYGSMLLGTLTSLLAAGWKFMVTDTAKPEERPLVRLYALQDEIDKADSEAALVATERRIDEILKNQLKKCAEGGADAGETAALSLATHRLERSIAQRRSVFAGRQSASLPA